MTAREVARAVARAGWPVIPMLTNTDEKIPCVAWKREPDQVCRSEADVVEKWPLRWPRWAAICGVPRDLDGRALVNLDADSTKAADVARSLLPGHTRVRTGRSGGEHTWLSVPTVLNAGPGMEPGRWRGLLQRFYLAGDLDWRGGNCIALLPESLWAPRSHPEVVYTHISGPALPEVLDVPRVLANLVVRRMARADAGRSSNSGRGPRDTPSGEVDLSAEGAFEKFLAAVANPGRQVRRTRVAGEAFVQCPGAGHPDQNRNRPCLHVTARGGGIVLHCFGGRGCTVSEIVAAFGLEMGDLYDSLDGIKITFSDGR